MPIQPPDNAWQVQVVLLIMVSIPHINANHHAPTVNIPTLPPIAAIYVPALVSPAPPPITVPIASQPQLVTTISAMDIAIIPS